MVLERFDARPRSQPPRGPHRSTLRARVDLLVLLYGSDELVALRGLTPRRVTWTRNRPAVADELSVTLDSDTLPFDLRLVASAVVTCWLYEHRDPARCKLGDPGVFTGRLDRIRRSRKGDVDIEARDYTGSLLDAKLDGQRLAKVDLTTAPSLTEVCRSILRLVPNTETWRVETVGVAGKFSTLATYSKREKVKPKTDGAPADAPKKALTRRRSTIATLLKGESLSAWEAICKVCALLGAVPEVDVEPVSGFPRLRVIDALAAQSSDMLRPFGRNDGQPRYMVVGHNVALLEETLELGSADGMPDFVRVTALNPDTGETLTAVYPDEEASPLTPAQYKRWLKDANGSQQVADGVSNLAQLRKLAQIAFEDARKNELRIKLETWQTWTTGGGPQDADLLDLGAGATLDVRFVGFDRLDTTATDVLRRRGLPAEVAAAIARAQERVFVGQDSLRFRVGQVVHTLTLEEQPSYSCEVELSTFLGGRRPQV